MLVSLSLWTMLVRLEFIQVLEEGIKLLNQWNNLKEVFKIPKKDKKPNSPKPRKIRIIVITNPNIRIEYSIII